MTTHRSWFPFILVGLSAALLAVILVAYRPNDARVDNDTLVVVAPTSAEYEAAVQTIVSNYLTLSSSDADKVAYDALLALRVPAKYKDVHVQLVLAFGQMVAGEDVAGKARLDDVMQVYLWVSPVFN